MDQFKWNGFWTKNIFYFLWKINLLKKKDKNIDVHSR